jgi:enoyl-CoA hydratase/carnithine racemase
LFDARVGERVVLLHGSDDTFSAAELVLLAPPCDARRTTELGLVTRFTAEADRMATALDTEHRLTRHPAGAVRASERLMKRAFGAQMAAAKATA